MVTAVISILLNFLLTRTVAKFRVSGMSVSFFGIELFIRLMILEL